MLISRGAAWALACSLFLGIALILTYAFNPGAFQPSGVEEELYNYSVPSAGSSRFIEFDRSEYHPVEAGIEGGNEYQVWQGMYGRTVKEKDGYIVNEGGTIIGKFNDTE